MKEIKSKIKVPYLLVGGIFKDQRGSLLYVNEFKFQGVKRFYIVINKKAGMIRAWHGHKKEAKYVTAISGVALVGVVKIDNWKNPSKKAKVFKFKINEKKPSVLYIPPGYANGFRSVTKNAKLMFMSNKTLQESLNDDYRFEEDYWNLKAKS